MIRTTGPLHKLQISGGAVVSTASFAAAFGISERAARAAFSAAARGHLWHGFSLPVVEYGAQRGGAGGKVRVLLLDRLTPELRARLGIAASHPAKAQGEGGVVERISDEQTAEQLARQRIIQPILDTPKNSRARGAATREAAAEPHDYPGGARTFDYNTLRTWVADFERAGFTGLLPKIRSDKGRRRVLITREWDGGIDLPEDSKLAIAAELAREARSVIANDGTSDREVLRICHKRLAQKCLAAGSALPMRRLLRLCILNRKWAERESIRR